MIGLWSKFSVEKALFSLLRFRIVIKILSPQKLQKPLNRIQYFLLKLDLYGYQKSVILWRFQKQTPKRVINNNKNNVWT